MPRFKFVSAVLPAHISDTEVDCPLGTTVFAAARSHGVLIDTACGGKGTCGLCRVRVLSGEAHCAPMSFEEKKFIGSDASLRLSCRIAPSDDVVVAVFPQRKAKPKK